MALSETTKTQITALIPTDLTDEEQALASIRIIKDNFLFYCERNLMIRTKAGEVIPLIPNKGQMKLVDSVMRDLAEGRPVRYIVLKARQMGFSTIIEALGYWWTATHKNMTAVIMAHDQSASSNLYTMFRRYYENSHELFQPDRKYNTKSDLTFDVEDKVKEEYKKKGLPHPGLGSQIKTMVAKDGKGRSDTINFFHGSEVAKWDASADILSGALQAIPLLPNTFAFLESTAQGVGGYFWSEWQFAKKGESAFKPFFFAWHEHDEYELNEAVSGYDEEELELLDIFKELGYAPETWDKKLAWRRYKLRTEFRTDPAKFYQEYPKNDMEAFLASGRPVFDISQVIKMERYLEGTEPEFGNIVKKMEKGKPVYDFQPVPKSFQNQDPTPLKVWQTVIPGKKYTIGVDVSDGIEISAEKAENDYSVIDVMRQDTLATVARWRGHIDPDLLGDVVFALGTYYNHALVGVEVNNHGLTTIQSLRNKFYRNLYMRETSEEDQFQERTSKMGWRTDRKTKPIMVDELARAIREGDIIDLDMTFISECKTYVRDDQGRTNAQEGMFDDCVMAKAINLQMADWNQYDTIYAKENIKKTVRRKTNATNTNSLDAIANPHPSQRTNTDAVLRRRQARQSHRRAS